MERNTCLGDLHCMRMSPCFGIICRRGRSGKFRSLDFLQGRRSVLPNASSGFALGRVHRAVLSLTAPDERPPEDGQYDPFQYNRRRLL